jgi:hypothetical protein
MKDNIRQQHGRGLLIILAFFMLIYSIGAFYFLLSWSGVQSFDPIHWQPNSIPFYALVFLIGLASVYGIWRWKKWGVYGLAGTWILTGIINLVFVSPAPVPYRNTFFAALLVIAFFLLLLPDWQNME